MSIDFQAPVESAYVNSKLMSRTSDTSTTGKVDFLNSTQSNDINTGAVIVSGGAAVKKNLNVGQSATVAGTVSSTGNITTAADFYALNAYITNQLTAIQVLADFVTGDSVTGGNVNANIALLASQKVSFSPQVDAALTGAGAVLTGIASKNIIFLTNASLTDISEIEAGTSGQLLILNNKTGATIIINHLTGTAGNQIDTGSGGASEMLDGSSIWLYYNTTNAVWNVIGGSGGGAKKDLSNLDPTSINEPLIPNADDSLDIGADGTSWASIYATTFAKDANNYVSLGSGQWVYNSVIKLDMSVAGEINVNTSKIKNVVDPTAAQDAATKNYVDTQVSSNSFSNLVTEVSIGVAAEFTLDYTKKFQTISAIAASIDYEMTSITPFGLTALANGSIVVVTGKSDTLNFILKPSDNAKGIIMDGNISFTRGKSAQFMYNSNLDRYVRIA